MKTFRHKTDVAFLAFEEQPGHAEAKSAYVMRRKSGAGQRLPASHSTQRLQRHFGKERRRHGSRLGVCDGMQR